MAFIKTVFEGNSFLNKAALVLALLIQDDVEFLLVISYSSYSFL